MKKPIVSVMAVSIIFSFVMAIAAQTCFAAKTQAKENSESILKNLGNKLVCPVMGSRFKPDKNTKSYEYKGKVYYFCCPGCVDKFKAEPKKYKK
jgi:YHS domain-containing protein